jgi:hypothetical protein
VSKAFSRIALHAAKSADRNKSSSQDPEAKMLSLQSSLRNGVLLGYVGRNQNLKDLTDRNKSSLCPHM